ncbi:DEAD/DEAH box helicase [Candidatus Uhrbacteria bacterium]|nr:DEAD/DEAH box helicase [Candidatus Uhrbacteria bacterium]
MHHTLKESDMGFKNLTIAPKLLDIIQHIGYTTPTPIQERAIPSLIKGKDLLGIAQTGTGKTLAYAVPVIQRLATEKGQSLILVPTRELALQVNESFEKIGRKIGLKTAVLIGGADIQRQIRMLKNNPHVIVGTPGRINDHIERKTLQLDAVKILVLDEADLMLDMGFAPQISRIIACVPKERQTMLFSATMPQEILRLAKTYMAEPVYVEVARSGTVAEGIEQEILYVEANTKMGALNHILKEHDGTVIVFIRTKHSAKRVCYALRDQHQSAVEIHSNRSLAQRRAALDGFKFGKNRILVATDIAARGIDVSGVGLIINYDLPENPEDYVHRIGRTGRAGKTGRAISLAAYNQKQLVERIEKLINTSIRVVNERPAGGYAMQEHIKTVKQPSRQPSGSFHNGRGGQRNSHQPHHRSKHVRWIKKNSASHLRKRLDTSALYR